MTHAIGLLGAGDRADGVLMIGNMTTQQFGFEDLFGSTFVGAHGTTHGTEADMAAQLSIFRGEPEPPRPVEISLSVAAAFDRYLAATNASPATRVEYATTLAKFSEWRMAPELQASLHRMDSDDDSEDELSPESSNRHRSPRPVAIRELDRESLREFLDWVYSRAVEGNATNPGRTANKARGNLSAVLNWACEEELIESVPKLPKKREQRDQAGLHFLDEAQINRLYWATYRLKLRGWRETHAPLGAYWRAALVVFYNYGVDTGTVFRYLPRHEPLLWRHVSFDPLCPDRSHKLESEFGWLYYVRTKTSKKFMRPMNRAVAMHLRSLLPGVALDRVVPAEMLDEAVFRGGSNKPSAMFGQLCRLSKLPAKIDFATGDTSPWICKDLRKTSATWHDENVPGAGSVVLGHAVDGSAAVTAKHYSNTSPLAAKSIMTLPQPSSFRSIWDDTIKAPDQLFAK